MTQSNEGKGYQWIMTIKTFEFGNTRSDVNCCDHWGKRTALELILCIVLVS